MGKIASVCFDSGWYFTIELVDQHPFYTVTKVFPNRHGHGSAASFLEDCRQLREWYWESDCNPLNRPQISFTIETPTEDDPHHSASVIANIEVMGDHVIFVATQRTERHPQKETNLVTTTEVKDFKEEYLAKLIEDPIAREYLGLCMMEPIRCGGIEYKNGRQVTRSGVDWQNHLSDIVQDHRQTFETFASLHLDHLTALGVMGDIVDDMSTEPEED